MIDFVFKYLMLTGLLIELIMIIAAKQRNQLTFGIIYCLCLDFQLLLLKLVFVSYHMLKFAKKKERRDPYLFYIDHHSIPLCTLLHISLLPCHISLVPHS